MQIVIDIPEHYYENNIKKELPICLTEEHIVGILPKGHTELVDRQIIADYVHSHIQEINTGYGDLNQHTNRILRMIEDYIDSAPTIIEADVPVTGVGKMEESEG